MYKTGNHIHPTATRDTHIDAHPRATRHDRARQPCTRLASGLPPCRMQSAPCHVMQHVHVNCNDVLRHPAAGRQCKCKCSVRGCRPSNRSSGRHGPWSARSIHARRAPKRGGRRSYTTGWPGGCSVGRGVRAFALQHETCTRQQQHSQPYEPPPYARKSATTWPCPLACANHRHKSSRGHGLRNADWRDRTTRLHHRRERRWVGVSRGCCKSASPEPRT
jgi:hypothetical protein